MFVVVPPLSDPPLQHHRQPGGDGEAGEPEEEPQPATHGGDDGHKVVDEVLLVLGHQRRGKVHEHEVAVRTEVGRACIGKSQAARVAR